MQQATVMDATRDLAGFSIGIPVLIFLMLAMMVIPLPPPVLDILFTFNISLALIVLLSGVYSKKPLDFAAFPTVLLISTLLRLALNIASTRVVLLNGHTGTSAAGHVIEAFGDFVVGGNYVVGLVVFCILVIINFVVVTKGAGRISEVSARFTLDAMPGKQMAIDADLNAGLIDQNEAKQRRQAVIQEADFYGAMDGASKFVRGDAIAGILILFVNVVGGLAVGIWQHGLAVSEAAHNYTLLTIGDGLVAQIPALVLSTAAAIMVTRVSSSQDMGTQILSQLFHHPRALAVTAGLVGIIGFVPGMPNLVFLLSAAIAGLGAYAIKRRNQNAEQSLLPAASPEPVVENEELSWDDVVQVDSVGLEVGYRLIPLVDKTQGGHLLGRIKGVRRKLTQEFGFLIPPVHIRDNLDLPPNSYRLTLSGVNVGEAEIYMDRELAINPGQVFGKIDGIAAKDPAFNMDAVWIEPNQRDQAQTMGYTVVDVSTVVATHLSQVIQNHAHELLGREEVQKLLDNLARTAPKLVEELVPDTLTLVVVVRVLKNLLEEGVPIRDMRSIAESLAEHGSRTQDADQLTGLVRASMRRLIVQNINGIGKELEVIALDPKLEQILQNVVQQSDETVAGLEPGLAERMHRSFVESAQRQEAAGKTPVLLVSALLRPMIARYVKHSIPGLRVLSYNEIPDDKELRIAASVGGE